MLHKSAISGISHGYVNIEYSNLNCINDININYDDYCLSQFTYEQVFSLDGMFGTCVYGSPYLTLDGNQQRLWHLDQIDGTTDNLYNYYDYNDDEDTGVDVYILDSGIRTTHQEFDGLNVGHHDWYLCFCLLFPSFFFFVFLVFLFFSPTVVAGPNWFLLMSPMVLRFVLVRQFQ